MIPRTRTSQTFLLDLSLSLAKYYCTSSNLSCALSSQPSTCQVLLEMTDDSNAIGSAIPQCRKNFDDGTNEIHDHQNKSSEFVKPLVADLVF
ncbi:hypothetical protein Patl1_34416 [Pistacia atlantica]|uniref:Uncharacterized protein n=1 Tax=Pistacia atlantica TaxID=434234 RepID=A0ACC0ZUI8_9ROSI|nr:hypothetical protein Patl1_34416 [Pistacia atlantica]